MVRGQAGRRGQYPVARSVQQAGNSQRIWRGRTLQPAWRRGDAVHRGISGKLVSASAGDAPANAVSGRNVAMGANGLSFAAPAVAGNSGLLQSQGIDLGPWAAEAGVLRLTEVLSGEGEGD